MTDKKYTKEDALAAWEQEDKKGKFTLETVDTTNGKQTQVLTENGSLAVAVDGSGEDAYRQLVERARSPFIDGGETPTKQVETDEPRRTKDGVLATPTDPSSQQPAEAVKHFVGGKQVSEQEAEDFRVSEAAKDGLGSDADEKPAGDDEDEE